MAEGFTNIYLEAEDSETRNKLTSSLAKLGVMDIESRVVGEEAFSRLSFNHNGSYTEKKLTTLLKSLVTDIPDLFIRARQYDDYGTEIYWLNDSGKIKRYLHEVDSESGDIVKAYNHWHSNLGSIWDGHFDEDDIQRIGQRFGFYDENGKAIKGEIENLAKIVTSTESFFNKNIKAPYASHKFDNYIAIMQSFAAIMVSKSDFVPTDKLINFERTFMVTDAFGSNVIGLVWSWKLEQHQTFLIITWHGDLASRAKIVVNHENLTIDEIIYIAVFDEFLKTEVIGNKQWVYAGFEQLVWPPCLDYIWNDSARDRDKYSDQNIVLQFTHVEISQGENGLYRVEEQGRELFEIHDTQFVEEMESLGPEKYDNYINAKADENSGSYVPRIVVRIQVQFKELNVAGKVLGVEVFGGEKHKCIYKRYNKPNGTWPVPNAP